MVRRSRLSRVGGEGGGVATFTEISSILVLPKLLWWSNETKCLFSEHLHRCQKLQMTAGGSKYKVSHVEAVFTPINSRRAGATEISNGRFAQISFHTDLQPNPVRPISPSVPWPKRCDSSFSWPWDGDLAYCCVASMIAWSEQGTVWAVQSSDIHERIRIRIRIT